ncbi:MAG: tetratricopeptide repeat protein [Gammaproteobacteria bacterium]|jgi:tetratricopeptide (TPR) repeat protein|nr:tetratricopeptide repeat protein [Gammaproteobacteria bacterium]
MHRDNTKEAPVSERIQNGLSHHRAGRLKEAEAIYQSVLREQPRNPQVLYLMGLMAHQLGKHEMAVDLLKNAIKVNPDVPDFHNTCGEAQRALQKPELAIACYERALALKPDYVEAHNNLGVALQAQGRPENAISSYERAIGINPDIAEIHRNLGIVLQELGRTEDAIVSLEKSLSINPDYAEAHNNLGLSLQVLDQHRGAISCFERALAINTDFAEAYNNLGVAQYKLDQYKNAISNYENALKIKPDFAETYFNMGIVLNDLRQHEDAIRYYEQALAIKPEYLDAFYNLAALYEKLNQLEQANIYVQKVLQLQVDEPRAKKLEAVLLRREEKYMEALDILKSISLINMDAETISSIYFEMGKLYDLVGDSDSAMQHIREGNRVQADSFEAGKFAGNTYLNETRNIYNQINHDWLKSWTDLSLEKEANSIVFLLGFPRSGTTLLDQILDGHPKIQVIEEKPMIENIVEQLAEFPGTYPSSLASLNSDDIDLLRKEYMGGLDRYVDREAGSIIVDKLPLNIVHVGLICRLFPNSKIILALRHPADVCLSNFMQHYKINAAMKNFFTLEDTATLYDSVMGLWQKYVDLLPLNYLEFKYELLVDNAEQEVKHLLNFLGAEWDPSLLDYTNHAKKRGAINTPSYSQVTQPIYQNAKYRWQRYEKDLLPIMNKLESHIDYFGY